MYPVFFPTLTATVAVTNVLGTNPTRVYPHGEAPQGVTLPYVTHQLVTGFPANFLKQNPDADTVRIQFNCYGATSDSATSAAQVIRNALQGRCYLVSYNGTGRDPDTNHYSYSFDLEFITKR